MKYQIWMCRTSTNFGKWLVLTPDMYVYQEESFKDAVDRMNIHELSRENV